MASKQRVRTRASCLTTRRWEKTGRKLEHITKVFDHVKMNYVLGYKLLLCMFFDGKSSLPFDFSIHEELGAKGTGSWEKRSSKKILQEAHKGSPAYEREKECGMSKMDSAVRMLQRMWKCGLRPHYALADSWFACEKFIAAIRNIGKGAIHYIGLAKMGNTSRKIPRRNTQDELRQQHTCRRTRCEIRTQDRLNHCRKYKCQYAGTLCSTRGLGLG